MAEVSRGAQVPCLEKKVFAEADPPQMYTRVLPINFFAFESELKNNVVDRFIDNHIFSECQELTSDLKVARPVDEKIDFNPRSGSVHFVTSCERGGGCFVSLIARTETARILCAEHLAIFFS